jgi:HSF-type DNA-binding
MLYRIQEHQRSTNSPFRQHTRPTSQLPITYGSLEALGYLRQNELFRGDERLVSHITPSDTIASFVSRNAASGTTIQNVNTGNFAEAMCHSNYNQVLLPNPTAESTRCANMIQSNNVESTNDDTNVASLSTFPSDYTNQPIESTAMINNPISNGKRQMGSFPTILYLLLEKAADIGYDKIVSWLEHGRAFKVHDQLKFQVVVMPNFFAQTQYPSFQVRSHFCWLVSLAVVNLTTCFFRTIC